MKTLCEMIEDRLQEVAAEAYPGPVNYKIQEQRDGFVEAMKALLVRKAMELLSIQDG